VNEQEQLERELGAGVRQFFTVKGAVKWMMAHHTRLVSLQQNPERGGGGQSREKIVQAQATYARILSCLQATMPDVDSENLTGRTDELVAWLCGERSQEYLADEAGLSVQMLSRRVGKAERVVKERMRARGLLKTDGDSA
jgi:hypothetical protein